MQLPKKRTVIYRNGRTVITSSDEQKHHIRMMWFDLIMKWGLRMLALYLSWSLLH